MTWRPPHRRPVRCPACAREPFPVDERPHADHVMVTYACACGHRFRHRHGIYRLYREALDRRAG